jgi:hypothetical protein
MPFLRNLKTTNYLLLLLTNRVYYFIFKLKIKKKYKLGLNNYWFDYFLNDNSDFLKKNKTKGTLVQGFWKTFKKNHHLKQTLQTSLPFDLANH